MSTQSCPAVCNSMNCSPPGCSVHGIFQARILEWVAISFSRGSSWPRDWTQVSCMAGGFFTVWATREDCQITARILIQESLVSWGQSSRWNGFVVGVVQSLSHVWLFATSWTVAHQSPPSMGFYRQEYWSGLPFPSPGNLPDPGTESASPSLAGGFSTTEPPG